jgi:hypothetical protein
VPLPTPMYVFPPTPPHRGFPLRIIPYCSGVQGGVGGVGGAGGLVLTGTAPCTLRRHCTAHSGALLRTPARAHPVHCCTTPFTTALWRERSCTGGCPPAQLQGPASAAIRAGRCGTPCGEGVHPLLTAQRTANNTVQQALVHPAALPQRAPLQPPCAPLRGLRCCIAGLVSLFPPLA